MMRKQSELKRHLRPGHAYRRSDLARWSNAVDRHLQQLLKEGTLEKLSGGVYYCPKQTVFGKAPATDQELVATFLKDDRFLLTSKNLYNALGVGTTQLYNEQVVYNHKRHGRYKLGGRTFYFRVKPHFPKKNTPEFLLVDLVNNLESLAEDEKQVLSRVEKKARSMDSSKLRRAVNAYAGVKARKFFDRVLATGNLEHAA